MKRFCWILVLFAGLGCAKGKPPATQAKKPVQKTSAQGARPASNGGRPIAKSVPPAPQVGLAESRRAYGQAMDQVQHGELKEAAATLDGNLSKYPGFAVPQYGRGFISFQQGRYEEAASYFSKAIALKPNFSEAYHGLAQSERQRGHLSDAEKAYQAALRYDKNNPALHYNLGILYDVYLGEPGKALSSYREYLKLVGPAGDKKVQAWIEVLERTHSS